MKKTLINLGLFQLGWLVCVLGGNLYAALYVLAALAIHQWLVLDNPREWLLIGAIAAVGSLWDIAMAQSGQIHYPDATLVGIPWWLISLWLLFATTFAHCLSWLRNHLWLAALLAAVFGPMSYWFGANLTAAELHSPPWIPLLVMGIGWAILFPLGIRQAANLNQSQRSSNENLA